MKYGDGYNDRAQGKPLRYRDDKTEPDFERIAFQSEKDDLLRELEQALADKTEPRSRQTRTCEAVEGGHDFQAHKVPRWV